jgi:glycosyltransferase involved in cell wall biosynthesis
MSSGFIKRFLRPYKRPVMRLAEAAAFYVQITASIAGSKPKIACNDRPRILVCDDNEPAFDRHAGGARMHEIIKLLADRAEIWFTALRPHDHRKYERELVNSCINILPLWRLRYGLRTLGFQAALVSRVEVGDELMHLVRKHSPSTKVIFDTVDIASVRLAREYGVAGDKSLQRAANKTRRLEAALAADADEVWCVTDADASHMSDLEEAKHIWIIPTIHTPRLSPPPIDGRKGLLFVGGSHRPNADAIRYFAGEIMPRVRSSLPGVEFSVAGSYDARDLRDVAAPDIDLLGYVTDLSDVLDTSRVFVCPLRYGSGMKGKIGEAMAAGLPVVTTSIGAEGMKLVDGETALIRDHPAEFAAAIVTLYNDPQLWQRLSKNGIRHVSDKFSPRAVAVTIDGALRELGVAVDHK